MAKRVRYAILTLESGETRMVQIKTTTENYMRKLIRDLGLNVLEWELI
jgi:hypothetical protein